MKTPEEWLASDFCRRKGPNTGNFTVYGIEAIQVDAITHYRRLWKAPEALPCNLSALRVAVMPCPVDGTYVSGVELTTVIRDGHKTYIIVPLP